MGNTSDGLMGVHVGSRTTHQVATAEGARYSMWRHHPSTCYMSRQNVALISVERSWVCFLFQFCVVSFPQPVSSVLLCAC